MHGRDGTSGIRMDLATPPLNASLFKTRFILLFENKCILLDAPILEVLEDLKTQNCCSHLLYTSCLYLLSK